MLRQEQENRSQMEFFCVEEFVPQDHLLRKIERVVDFRYIYELVEDLYWTIVNKVDKKREKRS